MLSVSPSALFQFQSQLHNVSVNTVSVPAYKPTKKVIIPKIEVIKPLATSIPVHTTNQTKSALKSPVRPGHSRSKSVTFNEELTKVRTFDKLLCPQAVSGKVPLSISCPDLLHLQHRIFSQQVCLESIALDSLCASIIGKIRVNNLDYAKKVILRYTFDDWNTTQESEAAYFRSLSQTSNAQDLFKYKIDIPKSILFTNNPKKVFKLQFAIQYNVRGEEHWDNNNNNNYIVDVNPSYYVNVQETDKTCSAPIPIRPGNSNRVRSKSFDSSSPAPSLSNLIQNTTTNSPFSTRYSFEQSLKSSRSAKVDLKSFCNEVQALQSEQIRSQAQVHYEPVSCSPISNYQSFGWGKSYCN
ncbi:hypothetical protein K502DRAFT_322758 [Neoconidiobolus thromboides FSU 785]|nr:hypothetical protein K502DRAFT_322758 [Neoconidiobolus thromboides FSU 785]